MEIYLAVALAAFCVAISPGPDFALISHYMLTGRAHLALFVVFGVISGLTIWVACVFGGLSLFFTSKGPVGKRRALKFA